MPLWLALSSLLASMALATLPWWGKALLTPLGFFLAIEAACLGLSGLSYLALGVPVGL